MSGEGRLQQEGRIHSKENKYVFYFKQKFILGGYISEKFHGAQKLFMVIPI